MIIIMVVDVKSDTSVMKIRPTNIVNSFFFAMKVSIFNLVTGTFLVIPLYSVSFCSKDHRKSEASSLYVT